MRDEIKILWVIIGAGLIIYGGIMSFLPPEQKVITPPKTVATEKPKAEERYPTINQLLKINWVEELDPTWNNPPLTEENLKDIMEMNYF